MPRHDARLCFHRGTSRYTLLNFCRARSSLHSHLDFSSLVHRTHFRPQEKKTGFWHQSDEAENRVGGMLALIASTAVFLAPDSPLGFIGRDHTILGVVLSVAIAVVVYEYDRYRTRLVMQRRAPHLPRVSSMSLLNVQSGKERLRQLLAALDCLDFSFVGAKLLAQRRIGQAEAEILALLTDAPPDELNYILTNTQLAYLLYKVKDGDVMAVGKTSSSTRTAILELLAIQRLHELEVEARVSLLDAFQVRALMARFREPFSFRNSE